MKKITLENYYLPCEQVKYFGRLNLETGDVEKLTEKFYIDSVSDLTLNENVPTEIRTLFDASIALYVYGYLYWTFFTLAHEQAFKAFEAAISYKHGEVMGTNVDSNGYSITLSKKINNLMSRRVLDRQKKDLYKAIRNLRNMSFHPDSQSQYGHNNEIIRKICNEINGLFPR